MKKIILALMSLVLVISFSIGTASAANSLRDGSKGINVGFGDSILGASIITVSGRYFTSSDFAILGGVGLRATSGDEEDDFFGFLIGIRKYLNVADFAPFVEGVISYETRESTIIGVDQDAMDISIGFGAEYFFDRQFSVEGTIAFSFGTVEDNPSGQDYTYFGTSSLGVSANFYF